MIGERFGPYQVLRQIAGGSAARVFLASDGTEVCAVKVFAHHASNRARREHRFGDGLEHPRLNRVDELVRIATRPAVRMPFVPGVQLSRWMAMHGGTARLVTVVADVLDALEYLHDRGIVHRDVKPENVLVGRDDRAVLIDFDLAARVGETFGNVWTGTPAWVCRAQAGGAPAHPRHDLHAAGLILYWGLMGALPYDGGDSPGRTGGDAPRTLSTDESLASGADISLAASANVSLGSSANVSLAPFDGVIARALSDAPNDGYGSAAEMRVDLVRATSSKRHEGRSGRDL